MKVHMLCALGLLAGASPAATQQTKAKPASPPSQGAVQRGSAAGASNTGSPFEFRITGAKTATVTGNDGGFCMSAGPIKDSQIFALSMVSDKWAISVTAMRPRPGVGTHAINGDLMEGIMADLIDKTTGTEPAQWTHRDVASGSLVITASSATKLAGTFEMRVAAGGGYRAAGKFEAKATKC